MTVMNRYGVLVDYDAAVELMDFDIMEDLHAELAPCSEQEFFDAYASECERRYGEEWELAKANPVY